jgi:CheY-like chemotaxis protein
MKIILDKLNITYDIANNGLEAVKLAQKNSYDLILMDINMPIMGGEEATKEIRKFNNIPIIALTANSLDGDKEKFLKAGMNDYLSKPLDIEKLKNILHKYEY